MSAWDNWWSLCYNLQLKMGDVWIYSCQDVCLVDLWIVQSLQNSLDLQFMSAECEFPGLLYYTWIISLFLDYICEVEWYLWRTWTDHCVSLGLESWARIVSNLVKCLYVKYYC